VARTNQAHAPPPARPRGASYINRARLAIIAAIFHRRGDAIDCPLRSALERRPCSRHGCSLPAAFAKLPLQA
jgi:hypothetical protein